MRTFDTISMFVGIGLLVGCGGKKDDGGTKTASSRSMPRVRVG